MTRLILYGALCAGCATTSTAGDVASVERTVGSRASLGEIALPRFEVPEEVPDEVDRLLTKPLSVDDAVRVALLSNRDARVALAAVGIARGAWVQAGLVPNPEVEFELRDPGGPQPVQVDVGLELNLAAALLAPMRAGVAEASLDAERWRAAGVLLDLTYETRLAYFEAQAAQQRLELRLRALASQQASYETAVELSRAGNLTALALANELVAVEAARVQVTEAESAWLDAREGLTRKLGLSAPRLEWRLAGPLTEPPSSAADGATEAKALTASLELAELQSRAEAASRKVGLAKTEAWLPHLSAGLHGERDGTLWELGAHLAVGLPFFDRAQGRRLSAQSEYELLRQRAEGQAVHIRSALRATLNRLESSSKRARHYRERLAPARQQALEQTVLQYNAMQLGVFQVLAAQRSVTETALAQVAATLDAQRAHASLQLLLAGRSTPLTLAVAQNNSVAPSADAMEGH